MNLSWKGRPANTDGDLNEQKLNELIWGKLKNVTEQQQTNQTV